ncbi:NADH-quinone oxidoreductase subunit N [Lampropedia hyalina DSM 16112]|jgi:NADH-quinone oxidoreductase subunit N|uniref:NADH-quinone oxidoreductase subunit N n=1 Tax=Lampropedia hyalina DSM 16112 TaxID=1122156 RepID=A0A1M5D514_9BURK|nr:NADH-quinone oxidoreductase subunit NuoN [Lampropedia hyalina]SHF62086.1 NADH-quinone oxidoreductase subunit N [Lampropedia hyalina DSM 16112]
MIDKYSWVAVYPELVLLVMGCVITLVDLADRSRLRNTTYWLSMLTLAVVAAMNFYYATSGNTIYGFGNMMVVDSMASWLKGFAAVAVIVTLTYGRPYAADRDMMRGGEMFSLSLFALLGIDFMISGNNLLLLYLGLELLTLSSYALVALRRDDQQATEAAMKYFVLGAMASGFLLYGMSMIYGATGSLDIGEIFKAIHADLISPQILVFGLVFVVAGLAFKLGAVPFHMWIPDVYEGAPTAITLMIASAPKLAAFGMIMRLLVDGLLPLAADWQQMLGVLAIGSLFIGNLAAIAQSNFKRMLAYSTISHVGFILLGLMSGVQGGEIDAATAQNAYGSAMFYVVTYVLTTLATFGIILLLAREGFEADNISDLAGLNQRSPLYAGVLAASMFSMAGIPPLVGFYAKFAVLQALIQSGSHLHIALAVFAVIMSLIGAFYYLRVIKVMYFDAPSEQVAGTSITASFDVKAVLAVNGGLVLVLGLLPGGLMALCAEAILNALKG